MSRYRRHYSLHQLKLAMKCQHTLFLKANLLFAMLQLLLKTCYLISTPRYSKHSYSNFNSLHKY
jgi:hypothetical protein